MNRRIRNAHRWIGVILALPLILWAGTGLLFHVKPGWAEAYDLLTVSTGAPLATPLAAPADMTAEAGEAPTRIDYLSTAIGPIARVRSDTTTALYDAGSGDRLSPVDADMGQKIVTDAVSRSAHRDRYGELVRHVATDDELAFTYASNVTITLHRHSLAIAQRGADTDRINWLYRVHYLQWTGSPAVDRVLGIAGIVALWLLAFLGLALLFRRRRSDHAR